MDIFDAADENARNLVQQHGQVKEVQLKTDEQIEASFADGSKMVLGSAFKFGYSGTGPDCFAVWLRAAGFGVTNKYIAKLQAPTTLKPTTGKPALLTDQGNALCPHTCGHLLNTITEIAEKQLSGKTVICPKCNNECYYPYL